MVPEWKANCTGPQAFGRLRRAGSVEATADLNAPVVSTVRLFYFAMGPSCSSLLPVLGNWTHKDSCVPSLFWFSALVVTGVTFEILVFPPVSSHLDLHGP